jgi:pyruvate-ferredoxin/flavodoxin oxidoreductase
VVRKNFAAVDSTLEHLYKVKIPDGVTSEIELAAVVPAEAPAFVQRVTASMIAGEGDNLPVSLLPVDGTYPSATTRWEKRNIALEVPVWDPDICIQCGKCVLVCPHAVIRSKVATPDAFENAPTGFLTADARWREMDHLLYTLQVAVEDCTGCALCVEVCPAKDKRAVGRKAINMEPQLPLRAQGRIHWDFFKALPNYPRSGSTNGGGTVYGNGGDKVTVDPVPNKYAPIEFKNVKNVQLLEPLFEFSGACAGCGETPYLSLLSRLYGDRTIVANATGCSSIYGGNLPTTPWAVNSEGRGPAWSNSLFEDNAEFGLGMRLTLDKQGFYARELLGHLRDQIGEELTNELLSADQSTEDGVQAQRSRVARLKERLNAMLDTQLDARTDARTRDLLSLADLLVKKIVWIVGGDGWAYDIGYGGLDHVLASGRNINILVMDTEVYSNTGGQSSKATPLAAVAKFAAGGKPLAKKDLGMMAINYGNVYVAQIAMGASDAQTVKAFLEAESYDGPSLIIAYSHCIAHGINIAKGLEQQKLATDSGHWPLYRYDPRLKEQGKNPFQLDSRAPKIPLEQYIYNENRYRMLQSSQPQAAEILLDAAQQAVLERWHKYEELAKQEQRNAEHSKAIE